MGQEEMNDNVQNQGAPATSRSKARGNVTPVTESVDVDVEVIDSKRSIWATMKRNAVMIAIIAIIGAITILGTNSHRLFSQHAGQINNLNTIVNVITTRFAALDERVDAWKDRNWIVRTFFVSKPTI